MTSQLPRRQGRRGARPRWVFFTATMLNLAATIHLVWFYLSYVPSYLNLSSFEQGLEKTPFQYRLLMMLPLRWAHQSVWLMESARSLSHMSAWFPRGVRPEGLVEAPINLLCVVVTGFAARGIYSGASRTGILTPYIYPLTLLMIACTYSLNTLHRWRFAYDLPSLAFFSIGLYLIYFNKPPILLAAVFLIATINRETSLFLLVFYLLRSAPYTNGPAFDKRYWRGLTSRLLLPALLLVFWVAWHFWVKQHFVHNESQSCSRVWLNVGTFLWPTSWTQLLSVFAFCLPLVFLLRREIVDPTLRAWQLAIPLWGMCMMRYGIFVEVRIFGELIPYLACMAALIAEEHIIRTFLKTQRVVDG